MKQLCFLCIFLLLLSCRQQTDNNSQLRKEFSDSYTDGRIKDSVKAYIEKDKKDYQPIGWGEIDSLSLPVSFKYRVSHLFSVKVHAAFNGKKIDSVLRQDLTFLLDSNLSVVGLVSTDDYGKYFNEEGVNYGRYDDRTLELFGLENGYDMVHFENGKKKLVLVGGKEMVENPLPVSKEKWVQRYLKGLPKDFLQETDTIEYCIDLSGDDCQYCILDIK